MFYCFRQVWRKRLDNKPTVTFCPRNTYLLQLKRSTRKPKCEVCVCGGGRTSPPARTPMFQSLNYLMICQPNQPIPYGRYRRQDMIDNEWSAFLHSTLTSNNPPKLYPNRGGYVPKRPAPRQPNRMYFHSGLFF